MRIVLVTYYYPPHRAVGALRPAKVCSALRAAEHDVHVIASQVPGTVTRAEPGVTRVVPIPNPREAWLWVKRRLASAYGRPDIPDLSRGYVPPVHIAAWKRWLLSMIWLPDDRQGFILPAVAAALPLLQRADLLYTTAPPFSTHVAGLLLKRLTHVRWAAEFRDPWTENPWKDDHIRSRLSDTVERALEDSCLRNADDVIGVSAGTNALLTERMRIVSRDPTRASILVRNGIDELAEKEEQSPRSPDVFRIVHVGTFYGTRDPRPFLQGLAAARAELSKNGRRVQLDLVGECRWFNGLSIEDVVSSLGLSDVVNFRDWLPHAEAVRVLQVADVLLLLAQAQSLQVPNKLYEYLGTRRPIIALADADGESARLLACVGGHFVVADDDPRLVSSALVAAASGLRSSTDERVLASLRTDAQMRLLVNYLERSAAAHGRRRALPGAVSPLRPADAKSTDEVDRDALHFAHDLATCSTPLAEIR